MCIFAQFANRKSHFFSATNSWGDSKESQWLASTCSSQYRHDACRSISGQNEHLNSEQLVSSQASDHWVRFQNLIFEFLNFRWIWMKINKNYKSKISPELSRIRPISVEFIRIDNGCTWIHPNYLPELGYIRTRTLKYDPFIIFSSLLTSLQTTISIVFQRLRILSNSDFINSIWSRNIKLIQPDWPLFTLRRRTKPHDSS